MSPGQNHAEMKRAKTSPVQKTIAELQEGEWTQATYFIAEKTLRKTRNGDDFISMTLKDQSGALRLIKFQAGAPVFESFNGFNACSFTGTVESYNGVKQIKAEALEPARIEGFDESLLVPSTEYDIDDLEKQLRTMVEGCVNLWVRALLLSFLDDAEIREGLRLAPAAKTNHHPLRGGLLEHIVSVAKLGRKICEHYDCIDPDILLAGVIFHDIGKIRELKIGAGIEYTDAGMLLGHITIGTQMIQDKARQIEGFPEELLVHLQHLVLSHHGKLEFGSPKLPATLEAVILHYIDNIDAKVWAYLEVFRNTPAGELWTDRHLMFGQKMYKGPSASYNKEPKVKPENPS